MLRNGLHSYKHFMGSQTTGEIYVLESRMREIRLSGLNGGLPLQDALFSNAEEDLP
jgi:hypothetical protein